MDQSVSALAAATTESKAGKFESQLMQIEMTYCREHADNIGDTAFRALITVHGRDKMTFPTH